jgi:hypothetical protein
MNNKELGILKYISRECQKFGQHPMMVEDEDLRVLKRRIGELALLLGELVEVLIKEHKDITERHSSCLDHF